MPYWRTLMPGWMAWAMSEWVGPDGVRRLGVRTVFVSAPWEWLARLRVRALTSGEEVIRLERV